MKKFLVGLSIACLCAGAWALPTVQEVEAQVQQGHYTEAESMMKEVVDAKPESAKGHYVYAELLAHNGKFSSASEEAGKAKSIDPQVKFTTPEKFAAFQQLLQREQNPVARSNPSTTAGTQFAPAAPVAPAARASSGIPSWIWLVGLALIAWALWRGFARSRGAAAAPAFGAPANGAAYGNAPNAGMAGQPYGTPYANPNPYANQAAPAGGGLLRTGAAVAGGVAAGMLADELIHRHGGFGGGSGNDQLSGLQGGVLPQPDDAGRQLEDRNVDFGSGGDWDAGGSAPDLGSGGGDDGGWD